MIVLAIVAENRYFLASTVNEIHSTMSCTIQ